MTFYSNRIMRVKMYHQNIRLMEDRKNPKLDLNKRKAMFFNLGLVVALGFTLMAFEWKFYEEEIVVDLYNQTEAIDDIIVPPTIYEPPKPPVVKHPRIIELPPDEDIPLEIEIDIDNDPFEEPVIENIVYEEAPPSEDLPTDFMLVETQPTFLGGGPEKFLEHIFKNIRYPDKARRMGIEGKVFVKFIIDKNGGITDVEVIKGIGGGCDEEAARAIEDAPDWTPGKQRGRPVSVRMMVPINFKLSR